MKVARALRLTIGILFAVAVGTCAVAGSASADVLCEDPPHFVANEEGSSEGVQACSAPYPTTGEFSAKGAPAIFVGKEFEVKCESALAGTTSKDLGGGKGFEGTVKSLTFTGCAGACSTAKALSLPFLMIGKATTSGNGTVVLSNGGSGSPAIEFSNCTFLKLSCTYTAESLSFAFKGGKAATLEAVKQPAKRIAGSAFCPTEGTESVTETLQQPGGGNAYAAAATVKPTVLCKTNAESPKCAAGNQYIETETIKAKAVAPGVTLKWNGAVRDTCTTSEIKITMSKKAAPMLGKVEDWTFANCTCPTKATRLPWALTIERYNFTDSGAVTLSSGGSGSPVLETLGCGGVNCNYVEEFGMNTSLRGNATAPTMDLSTKTFAELSGGCGAAEIADGKFKVETPLPLWVERAP